MRHRTIQNFFSNEECDELIRQSLSRLEASTVWDVATGKPKLSDYRVSDYMFFGVCENDFITKLEKRIATITGYPIENGEGLQVSRYGVGGYFKSHWDYFEPEFLGNESTIKRGGQRVMTVMVYLSDVQEGGETYFLDPPLSIKPEKGKAMLWHNVMGVDNGNGVFVTKVDPSTFHEAQPVIRGEKWIVTKWIREGQFV